jgi:acetoacetyl-CoA synthetase
MTDQPIWVPPHARKKSSNLARFMTKLADRQHGRFATFEALHAYSIAEPEGFWSAVWDEFGIMAETRGQTVFTEAGHMRHARFFPEARLNYAENLLKHSHDDKPAIIFRGEDRVRLTLSWNELKAKVATITALLRSLGTRPGDRVCAVVPNHPDTIAAFLAVNSIGAVWSSCSPDFGERGILDRFGQIEPMILIACDGYYYNGKVIDISAKIAAVAAKLPTVGHVLLIDYIGEADRHARSMKNAQLLTSAIAVRRQASLSF